MNIQRPNILLISLDSVRSETFLSGNFPILRALCQNGTLFSHTTCAAPLTPVSHSSVFTGLYPYHHGVRHLFRESLPKHVPTLAQSLKKAGYMTAAFVACAGLHRWYGLSKGFDVYEDELPVLADGRNPLEVVDVATRGSAYVKGEIIQQRATNWLRQIQNKKKPFFAFVHFFDAHWPYAPPEPFASRYSGHLYAGEVAYMDYCLADLLRSVDLKNTIIALFSDHGEDLGENGGVGSPNPQEMGHGSLLYENTLRVFMLLTGPGIPVQHITHQVRLVDLAPTLLDVLDLDPLPATDGRSLRLLIEGQPPPELSIAYSETFFPEELKPDIGTFSALCSVKLQVGEHLLKVVWQKSAQGQVCVYDLEADPYERNNLLENLPAAHGAQERLKALEQLLGAASDAG